MADAEPRDEPCRVRRARIGDHDLIRELLAEAWGLDFEARLNRSLAMILESNAAFLAHVGPEVCGCVLVTPAPNAILHALCIGERHRGRFYSAELVRAAVAWARELLPHTWAWTYVEQTDAAQQERFRRLGFTEFPSVAPNLTVLVLRPGA